MDKFTFVSEMINSFAPKKNIMQKEVYSNQIKAFSMACPSEFFQDVFNYAHNFDGYPEVKELFKYAKEHGFFGENNEELSIWECDHGGIGIPKIVQGNYCSKCGDKNGN